MSISFKQGINKLRIGVTVVGVTVMCILGSIGATSSAKAQDRARTQSEKREPPRAEYSSSASSLEDLNRRFNEQMVISAETTVHMADLGVRMTKQESYNIGEHFAKQDANNDINRWLLLTLIAGVITILVKDVITFRK